MKIAIVSDSHDNTNNITKVLDYLQKKNIEIAIHCGDLTSSEMLEKLSRFQGKVYLVEGNAETYQAQNVRLKIKDSSRLCLNNKEILKPQVAKNKFYYGAQQVQDDNINFFGKVGEIEIDGVKIGFTHKPKDAKELVTKDYDFVFYGHTHKPDIKKFQITNNKFQKNKETIVANPGNIMGQPYKATFAILDTKSKRLELVGLDKI